MKQAHAENGVEEHLVVERPSQRIGRQVAAQPRMLGGNEQIGLQKMQRLDGRGLHGGRHRQRDGNEDRREDPIERDHARNACPPEVGGPALAAGCGRPHDVAGDDEEQIDAEGAERLGVVGRQCGDVEGVVQDDQARRQRAQVLHRDDARRGEGPRSGDRAVERIGAVQCQSGAHAWPPLAASMAQVPVCLAHIPPAPSPPRPCGEFPLLISPGTAASWRNY